MKKITFLFILFILAAVKLYSQSGGWQWSNPKPQGGYVQNMKMIDANNWYLMCDYGVMVKTTNAGATWSAFSIGYQSSLYPGSGVLQSLYSGWFFDANNFILGSQSSRGVVRSTNGGLTFDTVQIASSTGSIYDFHFINAQTGYFCGTSTFKIQKTTNGGLNWTAVPFTPTSTLYSINAPDTNNIIVTSTSGNTYFTTNAGVNWTTSNVGTTNTLYDSKWINASTGYLCGSSGCFRYTTNFGANWTGTNPPTTATMNRVVVNGTDVYTAGFDAGMNMYKTTDNGATWTTIPYSASGQFTSFNVYAFDMVGSTMLVAGTYGLMNKSTNSGTNWQTATSHSTVANMVDIYAASGNGRVIAIGTDLGANDCIVYSTNGGNSWNNSGMISNTNMSDLSMRNSNTGYVVGRFGLFWKTTNGGVNWDTTLSNNPTLTPYFCNGVDFVDDNTGWVTGGVAGVGGSTKIWKTTNGGANWTEQTQNYSGPVGVRVEMLNASTGYFCGVNQIQKTTNGGDNWFYVTNGINVSTTYNGFIALDVNTVFASNSSAQVFGTTDGGANWANLNFPLTNIGTLFCTDWIDANTGMVAGIFGTVGKTTNRGASWELSKTGGYTTMGIDMVHPDTAFAVCGNVFGGEIFKYTKGLTGTITWQNEIPSDYSLSQNYPNPFNPVTKIRFSLPKEGTVTLKVFDITGQEVETIIDGLQINRGVITYDFDGSKLSSGVYFYSLFVDGNRIDTKKMVLVK
jgi:photosystem II stability/assembly factor-like uncharacterized protein